MNTERTANLAGESANPPGVASGDGADLARRVMDAFDKLIALDPIVQHAMLDDLGRSDPAVCEQVRAMLAHDVSTAAHPGLRTGAGLPGSVSTEGESADVMVGLPRLAGHYRVLRQIGEGGMGLVFLAEQSVPRRLVALKALKVGLTSRQVLQRFVREAHILGRLQHPGIAAIFEAGVVENDGVNQAYLVMEYVDGATITSSAMASGMGVRERLSLMAEVCDAAQHAHQRGVIHRDLKPTNILVDRDGRPKILDFGVARGSATDEHEEHTRHTHDGQLLGTLGYMSPEQISGRSGDADAASDVYALGAILYEMLAGRPAFDLRGLSLTQAIERVRSARLEPLGRLRRAYRGDIETIASTAMHPERERRYSSAAALADDLRRVIDGRPINARRDSGLYVISRLARRHWLLAGLGALALALVIGFAVYSWGLARRNASLFLEAEHARRVLDAESIRLRSALYSSRIGYAQAALGSGDVAGVRRSLDRCPPELRGWEWRYLDRASDQSVVAIDVPAGDVAACAVTSDGWEAVVATSDAHLTHIDLRRRSPVWSTRLPRQDLWVPMLSPDGRRLAVIGTRGELRRVDADSGAELTPLNNADRPDGAPVSCRVAVYTPASDRLLTGGVDGRIRVFEADTGVLVHSWPAHTRDVAAMAFSSDGATLMTVGTVDGSVALWRTGTWELLERRALDIAGEHITTAAMTPDASQVVVATVRSRLQIWTRDAADPGDTERTLTGLDRSVLAMAVSPDGRTLATGGRDGLLRTWDLASGAPLNTLRGEPDQFRSVHWPVPDRIVTTGAFSKLRVWSPRPVASSVEFGAAQSGAPVLRVLDERRVAIAGSDRLAMFSPGAERTRVLSRWAARRPRSVLMDSEGRIVTAGHAPWLRVDDPAMPGRSVSLPIDAEGVGSLDLSEDGGKLALGLLDGSVCVLGWPSGEELWRSPARNVGVARALFVGTTPRADDLVVVWNDGRVSRVSGGQPHQPPTATIELAGVIHAADLSPNGKLLAIVGESGTVRVVSTGSLGEVARSSASIGPVFAAAFIDDTRLAVGGGDRAVRILDARTGEELLVLKGHRSSVACISALPGTGTLASVDWFGQVRVYLSGSPALDGAAAADGPPAR